MATSVELIKERLDIVEVISSYIKLEKAGINFKARCPFHNEKTPSFSVSPSRGSFYCFGCGEKGDMFSFVEKYEGVDFKGALKILAERAGVPLVFERKQEGEDEKDRLLRIMEDATAFFEDNLKKETGVREYLLTRGLSQKTIDDFRIGYALPEWRSLLSYLRTRKHPDALIEKTGLIKKGDESGAKDFYDRFRGRIMFPIDDPSGRPIAFSGRVYEPALKAGEEPGGKYINSPETPLFSKSKILYGYDKAKEGMRKWGFVICVEGQMDMLMSHQAGFRNTVALSGTALTPEHLTLIGRLTQKLVLALDSDAAGIAASGKSASLALSRNFDVKAARLEGGKDPADLVAQDPELWKKSVREAVHIIDFYLDVLARKGLDDRKLKLEVTKTVIPFVADVQSPIDRAHFAGRVALRLRLSEKDVLDEVEAYLKKKAQNPEYHREVETPPDEPSQKSSRADAILEGLVGLLLAEERFKEGKIPSGLLKERLIELLGEDSFEKVHTRATLSPDILFEAETHYGNSDTLETEAKRLLLSFEYQRLKDRYEQAMRELRGYEAEGKTEELAKALRECDTLSKQLTRIDIELKSN